MKIYIKKQIRNISRKKLKDNNKINTFIKMFMSMRTKYVDW